MVTSNKPTISTDYTGQHELKYFDSSHRYYLDKKSVKSITGVGDGYPKGDALSGWKTDEGVKHAIKETNTYWKDNQKGLAITSKVGKDLIETARSAYTKATKRAASIGNTIHDYAYALQSGKPGLLDDAIKAIEEHPSRAKALKSKGAVDQWFESFHGKIRKSEEICGSASLQIAGRFDALIERDGEFGVMDYKTSKRIYIDHFLQCAGYSLLIPEWFGHEYAVKFFEVVHFSKDTGEVSIGLMDHEGYKLNGQLVIPDPLIVPKMIKQFLLNVGTVKFMKEFKDFWRVANG